MVSVMPSDAISGDCEIKNCFESASEGDSSSSHDLPGVMGQAGGCYGEGAFGEGTECKDYETHDFQFSEELIIQDEVSNGTDDECETSSSEGNNETEADIFITAKDGLTLEQMLSEIKSWSGIPPREALDTSLAEEALRSPDRDFGNDFYLQEIISETDLETECLRQQQPTEESMDQTKEEPICQRCAVCKATVAVGELRRHLQTHRHVLAGRRGQELQGGDRGDRGRAIFRCLACRTTFSPELLRYHAHEHRRHEVLQCQESALRVHWRRHHRQRHPSYQCTECGATFRKARVLLAHHTRGCPDPGTACSLPPPQPFPRISFVC